MALTSKGRLISDPAIGVSDLMEPLKLWAESTRCKDVLQTLEIPQGINFKSGINVEWVATVGPLFESYAKVAPNSMLPPKKHRAAIMQLTLEGKITHGRKSDKDFSDFLDESLRVGFSQYRQMVQTPELRERAFRKASPSQVEAIQKVLGLLSLAKDVEGEPVLGKPISSQSLGTLAEEQSVVAEDSPAPASIPLPASIAAPSSTALDPANIFASILGEPDLKEEDFNIEEVVERTPEKAKTSRSEDSPLSFDKLFSASSGSRFVAGASELVEAAAEVLPLGEDGKSQLVIYRQNAPAPKKKMTAAKAKTQAAKKKQPTPCKKPATCVDESSQHAGSDEQEAAPAASSIPVVRLKRKQSIGCGDDPNGEGKNNNAKATEAPKKKEKKPMDMSRAARRKRVCSRAWHTTFDGEIAKGVPDDQARVRAREAHAAAAKNFDKQEPVDKR